MKANLGEKVSQTNDVPDGRRQLGDKWKVALHHAEIVVEGKT